MGVESDHLVYDYLSRVGDLAQTALPADRRMRLVTELRKDIDHERSKSGSGDDAATVRRILGKLGSPDEVVKAAARRPLPRGAREAAGTAIPLPRDEAGPGSGEEPEEWWRLPGQRTAGGSAARTNEVLAGWTGGLLTPELEDEDEDEADGAAEWPEPEDEEEPQEAASGGWRRFLGAGRRRQEPDVRRRRLPVGPLELLAALALVAGVVVGSWWALGVGWLIAYWTRGLSRTEAKWAALGMPGLVAAGELVWLWGRMNGRWGRPLSGAQLGPVIAADFPVAVKVAAIASAAFLLWRSARRFR